jgi:hypothetical protein
MGRNRLPAGVARTAKIMTKVRPAAKEEFTTLWKKRGFATEADAVRHALTLFKKERP